MNKADLVAVKLYASSTRFLKRVDEAYRHIAEALQHMQRPSVAFSGGKDSTCVGHLVLRQCPNVALHFGHEQWLLPETEEFIAQTPGIVKTALPDSHTDWFHVWQDKADVPADVHYIDPARFHEFNYEVEMMGWDGTFLGLRAEENTYRRIFLHRFGVNRYCQSHQKYESNPIAFWSVWDVWAYIYSNDVPYNKAYDRLAEIGVPLERQRIGPLAQTRVLEHGQLATLRKGWPELFDRFAKAFPEASSYT